MTRLHGPKESALSAHYFLVGYFLHNQSENFEFMSEIRDLKRGLRGS